MTDRVNALSGFTSAGEKAKRGGWFEPRVSGKGKPPASGLCPPVFLPLSILGGV